MPLYRSGKALTLPSIWNSQMGRILKIHLSMGSNPATQMNIWYRLSRSDYKDDDRINYYLIFYQGIYVARDILVTLRTHFVATKVARVRCRDSHLSVMAVLSLIEKKTLNMDDSPMLSKMHRPTRLLRTGQSSRMRHQCAYCGQYGAGWSLHSSSGLWNASRLRRRCFRSKDPRGDGKTVSRGCGYSILKSGTPTENRVALIQ